MTKSFRDFCTFSSKQHGHRATPKRGHAIIDDGDGHEYQYRVTANERRDFKDWARQTFTNYGEHKLTGRWPNYQVERVFTSLGIKSLDRERNALSRMGAWLAGPSHASLVAAVKSHALANYESSPVSWDCLIECWSDYDIAVAIINARTVKAAIRKIAVRLPERIRPLHTVEI